MIIATIDPGIDVMGVAIWKTEFARPAALNDSEGWYGAAHALADLRSLRTRRTDESLDRCRTLSRQLAILVAGMAVEQVYIEIPPLWHAARQKGARTGSHLFDALFKLNRSIGAAAAAIPPEVVLHEIPASKFKKTNRLAIAFDALVKAGKPEPRNEDEKSAAWIGLEVIAALSDGFRPSKAVRV